MKPTGYVFNKIFYCVFSNKDWFDLIKREQWARIERALKMYTEWRRKDPVSSVGAFVTKNIFDILLENSHLYNFGKRSLFYLFSDCET